jgi:hypothetical protein
MESSEADEDAATHSNVRDGGKSSIIHSSLCAKWHPREKLLRFTDPCKDSIIGKVDPVVGLGRIANKQC